MTPSTGRCGTGGKRASPMKSGAWHSLISYAKQLPASLGRALARDLMDRLPQAQRTLPDSLEQSQDPSSSSGKQTLAAMKPCQTCRAQEEGRRWTGSEAVGSGSVARVGRARLIVYPKVRRAQPTSCLAVEAAVVVEP